MCGVRHRFCYLGDMLSVDGSADAAVTARIRSGPCVVRTFCSRDLLFYALMTLNNSFNWVISFMFETKCTKNEKSVSELLQ